MRESSGKGKSNLAATLLSCAIISLGVTSRSDALAADATASGKISTGLDGISAAQEVKAADALTTELQVTAQESKSITRQTSRTQRRRKPKMAGVPDGTPILAQEPVQVAAPDAPKAAALAKAPGDGKLGTAAKPPAEDKPKPEAKAKAVDVIRPEEPETEEVDPFASAKPKAPTKKAEEPDPFATPKLKKEVAETKPSASGKRYRMAPIKWGARVTETLSKLDERYKESKLYGLNQDVVFETNRKSFFNTQTAEVKASTYVLQPYIAQIDGNLGLVHSKENKKTVTVQDESTMSREHEGIRHNKLFGGGSLALFARSRFPFSASFNVTNSHADSDYIGSDTKSKTVFLQQDYRPARGTDRYSANYQLTSSTSNTAQKNSYSALYGSYSTRLGQKETYPFNTNYKHSVTDSYSTGKLTADILTAHHSYLPPESLLSVNSSGAYTLSRQRDPLRGIGQNARFLQLNSVIGWQPESEDIPLFVTGNGRYFDASTETQGTTYTSRTLGVSGSALYDASTNLKYHGDASVTHASSNYTTSLTTVQRGRAVYRSDDIKLQNNTIYFWTTNAGLINQTQSGSTATGAAGSTAPTTGGATGQGVGGSGRNTRAFGGAGHSLQGGLDTSLLGRKWPIRYTINQDLSANAPMTGYGRQIAPKTGTLRNNVILSTSYDKNQWSFLGSVSLTDMKTWGGLNPSHTKVVAVTLGGRGKQPIYEGYGAKVDGTVQVARSSKGTMQASGALVGTYLKHGVFGIRGLSYSLRGDMESRPVPPIEQPLGNTPGSGGVTKDSAVSYGLNQNLMYRIGMNEVRLAALFEDRHGVKRATFLMQFKVWRTIGN